MSGLQRHFDLLAFNLAAHDTVLEETYDKRVNASPLMPSPQHHQNFEQLQAYARDLIIRQIINDSLNLTLAAMNNAHLFLSLIKVTDGNKKINIEGQQRANASQKHFIRAKLDEKFTRLEKDYGIMCELEDSIIALGFMLQILIKQNKIVQKEQLDKDGKLILELKSAEVPTGETPIVPDPKKFIDVQKIYHEGDAVFFDDIELQLVLVTIASFADSLFKSVAAYARSSQKGA